MYLLFILDPMTCCVNAGRITYQSCYVGSRITENCINLATRGMMRGMWFAFSSRSGRLAYLQILVLVWCRRPGKLAPCLVASVMPSRVPHNPVDVCTACPDIAWYSTNRKVLLGNLGNHDPIQSSSPSCHVSYVVYCHWVSLWTCQTWTAKRFSIYTLECSI